MTEQLKPLPEHATIQVPAQAWNDMVERIVRMERLWMHFRESEIKNMSAVEDAFALPRTKEKRVR